MAAQGLALSPISAGDGLVREIHTGFTSGASGKLDSELKDEITTSVAHLLAEDTHASAIDQNPH